MLVLGDQLSDELSALREGDPARDVVVMAEVRAETDYVAHHPKKVAFLFAAMRKHADRLRARGWTVRYTALDDEGNAGSIPGELLRAAEATGAQEVLATEPGEFRLIAALEDLGDGPLPVHLFPDDRFLCTHAEFETWAEGRKELRMEWFYRDMRRKTGLLMTAEGKPEGEQVELRPRQPQARSQGRLRRGRADAVRAGRDDARGIGPRGAGIRQPVRQPGRFLVRHRPRRGGGRARPLRPPRPAQVRRLPGRDGDGAALSLPRRAVGLPERGPPGLAGVLRGGGVRLEGGAMRR